MAPFAATAEVRAGAPAFTLAWGRVVISFFSVLFLVFCLHLMDWVAKGEKLKQFAPSHLSVLGNRTKGASQASLG